MTDPFAAPSSVPSDIFKLKDHIDKLVLFKATGKDDAFTFNGKAKKPVEVVFTDAVVINESAPAESSEFHKAAVSPYGVRRVLEPTIDKGLILGRIRKAPDPSPNESGAYSLGDPTDAEKDLARAYLASKAPQL